MGSMAEGLSDLERPSGDRDASRLRPVTQSQESRVSKLLPEVGVRIVKDFAKKAVDSMPDR